MRLIISIICALLIAIPSVAFSYKNMEVLVTWDMEETSDLAGFDLRCNEDNSTLVWIEGDVASWSGELMLNDGRNTVEMRARDVAGNHSEWSEESIFDPKPGRPSIIIIILR